MSAFSIFLGLLFLFNSLNLLNLLADHSKILQQLCISYVPNQSEYRDFTQAIVCGSTLPNNAFNQQLKDIGLIHLIVVSGSHLIFLSELINKFPFRHMVIRYLLLICFSLLTGFQAPVARALSHQILCDLQSAFRLNWSKTQIVWNASLFCLALNPIWINSISFLLSWAASLALSLVEKPKGLKKHVLFFVIFSPLLAYISTLNPITILTNWLLAPIIGMVLFPLSLVSFLLTPLSPIVEVMWFTLDKVSFFISKLPLFDLDFRISSTIYLWIYIWLVHFGSHYRKVIKIKWPY